MTARYRLTKRSTLSMGRRRKIRAAIRQEFDADIVNLTGMNESLLERNLELSHEVGVLRDATLMTHLHAWWKGGPCPRRWRTFLSR